MASASPILLLPSISLLFIFLSSVVIAAVSQSTIQLPSAAGEGISNNYNDKVYCDSWKLSSETNNAGDLASTKPPRCHDYLVEYLTGDGHLADADMVAYDALAYAKTVEIVGDGKDGWIFDLDETLLTNLPYFKHYDFGYIPVNYTAYSEWVDMAAAPAFPSSLKLFNELKKLGFAVIIVSARTEADRNSTEINLMRSGFNGWDRLIFWDSSDAGKGMKDLKTSKRKKLKEEGYRLHANYSHQWSSLLGDYMAAKNFKFPNPMYYVPDWSL
ncbi:Acid phosphatase 1 [Linum grandiflorum]